MNIIRHYTPIRSSRDTVDETLESFFGDFFSNFSFDYSYSVPARQGHVPAANTRKTETGYEIELAIPGIDKNDIQIAIEDNELKVVVELDEEVESTYARQEFSYTGFSRTFKLPRGTEHENIVAIHDNGILKIEIPNYKVTESRRRTVNIN